jgi:hypothetical protein
MRLRFLRTCCKVSHAEHRRHSYSERVVRLRYDLSNIPYRGSKPLSRETTGYNITLEECTRRINAMSSGHFTRDWYVAEVGTNDWKFIIRMETKHV